MGLFDKFKKKRENKTLKTNPVKKENHVKLSIVNKGKVILDGFDKLNSREEAKECVIMLNKEIDKLIDLNFGENTINLFGIEEVDINKAFKKHFKESIKEQFVKYYGTQQEKEEYKFKLIKREEERKKWEEERKKWEEERKKWEEYDKKIHKWAVNNQKGIKLKKNGKNEEAIKVYEENVKNGTDTPHTYYALAGLYHDKQEYKKEINVLKKGIQKCRNNSNPKYVEGFKIKEAKLELKEGNKEKGIILLEELVKEEVTENTVYYTLYQTYQKNKQYNEAIRICNKALEVLGTIDEERGRIWNKYLNRVIKKRDKEQ